MRTISHIKVRENLISKTISNLTYNRSKVLKHITSISKDILIKGMRHLKDVIEICLLGIPVYPEGLEINLNYRFIVVIPTDGTLAENC